MSYELVKNIDFKKHTITSAENNVRPLQYRKHKIEESDYAFIGTTLLDIKEGMLHLKNYNLFYLHEIIKNADIENDCEKLWSPALTEQEYKELRETIKNKLVSAYKNYNKIIGTYCISNCNYYNVKVQSITSNRIKFTTDKNKILHFKDFHSAEQTKNFISKHYSNCECLVIEKLD